MKNSAVYILLLVYSILAALTIIFFDGAGDGADSVNHYLYARFAPQHPELFFNHWAKPVFVLLASPFAQFGFTGVKVFNAIVTGFTIWFTYRNAQLLKLKNAIVCAILLLCSPQFYALTFSGLTEPLFALFTTVGIYAALKKKYLAAALVISFLPFVRSEGLIILGVFGIYFLLKHEWRCVPALLFGHLAYSLAGYFVYHDLLWVFTKIPYANMGSPYGSGKPEHFVIQFYYITGAPVYVLFWLGTLAVLNKSVKREISIELPVLVLLGFFTFFVAHTLFWYLGIFNSMGLKRVLVGVMPLAAIIALAGFNFITAEIAALNRTLRLTLQAVLVLYIGIFPFTSNKAALKWDRDLRATPDQLQAISTAEFIFQNTGTQRRFHYDHPYLSDALGIDPFDPIQRVELSESSLEQIKTGDVIIWTTNFAPDDGLKKEMLDNHPQLATLHTSSVQEKGREIVYQIYVVK